ncbi:NXPE family member 4-like isoform X4 [Aquarana catesbeiana]
MTTESKTIDQQIAEIMTLMNCTIPQKDTMYFNETTSAINSKAIILNYKPSYCLGDTLIIQVEMFNYLGKRKTYGGDFLQARIFSPKLGAGASGRIKDFNNGTYNIYFTLFWKGPVQISILLMHPSEGVSLLWKGRNMGYNYISFTGKFLNKNQEVQTECGFYLNSQQEKCKYVDRKYREVFYCIKLPEVPCEAFISLNSENTRYTYLTNENKTLFSKSNIGIEIPKQVGSIDVLNCPKTSMNVTSKCQIGTSLPFPSGYFLKNQWFPSHCNLSSFEPLLNANKCLAGKIIYLMGDSTIRQWIDFFPKVMKIYEVVMTTTLNQTFFLTVMVFFTILLISFTVHYSTKSLDAVIHSSNPTVNYEEKIASFSLEDEIQFSLIFKNISVLIPSITFTHKDHTTSAKKSRATIPNPRKKYCVGETIIILIEMFDLLGNRKTYGGDFIRARIFSPDLKAAASGRIEDFNNGTYHAYFTLFWEGNVFFSLILYHPSEAVSALWRARNWGYGLIYFTGTFTNGTHQVKSECGFQLNTKKEICEYRKEEYNEIFYCAKPESYHCGSLIYLQSFNRNLSFLSILEKSLFERGNIANEIPKNFKSIGVYSCTESPPPPLEQCKIGMVPPFPSGFVLQNKWRPAFCRLANFTLHEQMYTCLYDKMIYLMGDSTVRQWYLYLIKSFKGLKQFDLHRTGLESMALSVDLQRNIRLQWKKHSHPFVASQFYLVKDDIYVSEQIDQLDGGPHYIIVICLGQHFRFFPIHLFIKRVINVRKALERLFLRSPDAKVIIKAENTREISIDAERFSDFNGYIQYLIVKDIFRDLHVGVIDAWDMTTAYNTNNVHPPENVVQDQLYMFLTYIC